MDALLALEDEAEEGEPSPRPSSGTDSASASASASAALTLPTRGPKSLVWIKDASEVSRDEGTAFCDNVAGWPLPGWRVSKHARAPNKRHPQTPSGMYYYYYYPPGEGSKYFRSRKQVESYLAASAASSSTDGGGAATTPPKRKKRAAGVNAGRKGYEEGENVMVKYEGEWHHTSTRPPPLPPHHLTTSPPHHLTNSPTHLTPKRRVAPRDVDRVQRGHGQVGGRLYVGWLCGASRRILENSASRAPRLRRWRRRWRRRWCRRRRWRWLRRRRGRGRD